MKKIATYLLACVIAIPAVQAAGKAESTRHERNYIVDGNNLYRDERFAEAEVAYRKALEENAMNEIARFNLAASLLRQGNATGETAKEAVSILQALPAMPRTSPLPKNLSTTWATSHSTSKTMPKR